MERNLKKIGVINLVVLLGIGVASTFLARYSNSLAAQTAIIFLGLGFLVMVVAYFQMRMEETERLEKLEFDELNKTAASGSLFNTGDAEVFPARRSREQFERFFVPGFTVVLFLLQAGGAYWLWTWLGSSTPVALRQPTVAMALFGLFALTLFLLGKYSVGLSRLENARLLRPGASYLLLGAYACFAVTICIAAVELGFPRVDYYAALVLAGVLALIAAETLINLVLEIYRPRVAGKVARLLYDSRLVGLLAEPEGLFSTAAHALDYQFGFKVSDTWFYRFLEKALVWLILLQLGILLLSTSFVFIGPGEQGLLERFGRAPANQPVLEPGLHVKFPWPIDQVHRFHTLKIQSVNVGSVAEAEEDGHGHGEAVLWTVKHSQEELNWLVPSRDDRTEAAEASAERGIPADLINLSVPIQFQISDLRAWAYNHTDAAKLLEWIATREVVSYLAGTDLFHLLATGREEAAEALRARIQQKADDEKLGVKVVLVAMQDVHPPAKVAPTFQEVLATLHESEAKLHEARGYSNKTVTLGRADAQRQVTEARAYSNREVQVAAAQAGQFTNQVIAYHASPRVYMERSYLQALERGVTNSRRFVFTGTNKADIIQYNLEERIRGDLISDLTIPPAR